MSGGSGIAAVQKQLGDRGVMVNAEWLQQGLEELHRRGRLTSSSSAQASAETVFLELYLHCDLRDSCPAGGVLPKDLGAFVSDKLFSPRLPTVLQVNELVNIGVAGPYCCSSDGPVANLQKPHDVC